MSAVVIDGKALAAQWRERLTAQAQAFQRAAGRAVGLAVVQVGADPASSIYVRNKRRACEDLGLVSFAHDLAANTPQAEVLDLLHRLNQDPRVDGILVQLPLPRAIASSAVIEALDPAKDVDGLHPINLGRLLAGEPRFVPCTPAGVLELIRTTGVELAGKRAVVIGRSILVGKPTALLLLQAHATVTICHSRTVGLDELCRSAEVLVVAMGRPESVPGDWIRPGAIVIDVGTNRTPAGLRGDVDFKAAQTRAGFITPVPGGVGPMTITLLMANTLKAAYLKEGMTA